MTQNENENIKRIFGVRNSSLVYVFDIINWVCTKPINLFGTFKEPLKSFFSSPSFIEPGENLWAGPTQNLAQMLSFISAFNKGDVYEILKFLVQANMTEEYSLVCSYYIYIGVLNNWVTHPEQNSEQHRFVSQCLAFPLIQQIYSSLVLSSKQQKVEGNNAVLAKMKGFISNMSTKLYSSHQDGMLERLEIEENRRRRENKQIASFLAQNSALEQLFSGKIFGIYGKEVYSYVEGFARISGCPATNRSIGKLTNLYLFKPDFAQDTQGGQTTPSANFTAELIKNSYKVRDHWEGLKRSFHKDARNSAIQENDKIANLIFDEANSCYKYFTFMNVGESEVLQMTKCIYPTMIYMFVYLKSLKGVINPNDNGARMFILRQTLNFIWKLFMNLRNNNFIPNDGTNQDPTTILDLSDKTKKIDFLNRYTGIIYNLRIKKSNIYILKDLFRFAIKYIFYRAEKKLTDKKFDELINSLKLDSFMELHDYLDELDNSKEVSENYKENIVNMFIQFVSDKRFKKHVSDIKSVVKLVQGDFSKINYFIDRLFTKSESVGYTNRRPATLRAMHKTTSAPGIS